MDRKAPERKLGRRQALVRVAGLAISMFSGRLSAQRTATSSVDEASGSFRVPWDERFELEISFQVGDPRSAFTRRPYVAVFVEDMEDRSVRTVSLWAQRTRAWLRQLSHWFRAEAARQRTEGGSLITRSTATRPAGRYSVVWDGRDNNGELVEQGRYYICIETVRQNAGNHLVRQDFEFGTEPFTAEIEPYADLSNISLDYRHKQ